MRGITQGEGDDTFNVSVHQHGDVWAMAVSVETKRTANRLRETHLVLLRAQVGNVVLQIPP